ncbi:MAG: ComEC/Rec2 family competence protein, partial [Planctomycetota bacterium]
MHRSRAPTRPLLRLALALALGSAWGVYAAPPRALLLFLATSVAAGWISWRLARIQPGLAHAVGRQSPACSTLGFGLFALVAILGALRALPESHVPWSPELSAWEGVWRTRREDDSEVRGTLEAVGASESAFELPRGSVLEGERIRILRGAPPAPPARSATDASDDAPGPRLVVAESDEILRLATPRNAESWIAPWRAKLERRAALLEDQQAASLAQAFLLGDSSALDSGTADLFTRNGLRHVLAVSGWHVAMMAWLIVRPFAALAEWIAVKIPGRRRLLAWFSMLASVALCIAYVPLTGGGAPVRRSAIAVALASTVGFWPAALEQHETGVKLARRIDALSLWAAALCVECWLDPAAISEVAVQLSYAATLGLIVATRPLSACLAQQLGLGLAAEPRELLCSWPRQCACALRRRCTRSALSGISASIAAVAATAPIVWLTFGEACPWGLITTPLFAPLFVALFATGMLMLVDPIGLFATLFTLSSRALLSLLEAVDRLPATPSLLPERPAWLVFGALAAAWAMLRFHPAGLRLRCALRAASALAAAALLLPWSPAAGQFELHILEVGHGTCAVFRAPGEPCWIFDCGSKDRSRVAQDALAPLLRSWEVDEPKVVLSHTDSDHAGGLRWAVERAPPRQWAGAL